jgi:putative ABC transport system permease protein
VGGVIGGMAARGVVTSLSRTAPAVVALVMAVSVVVGLGTMIHGFRGSVERWLQVTLQADLYVSSPSPIASRAEGLLPQGLPEAVEAIPEVTGVSTYRGLDVRTLYGPTRIAAVDLHPKGEAGLDLIQAVDGSEEALRRFRGGEGVLVSEPFSIRHDTGPGERVRLEAPTGSLDLPVLGVFRDYGTEMGVIMLPRTVFDGHWRDRGVTSMGVFLASGADGEEMSARIRALAGADAPVVVRSNAELRRASMEVFDRTFAITGVLQFLAATVAFIAVLSALTALQLERRWELGVLRANGMTPGQTWGLVTTQTGLMGLVAGVLALPVGLVLAVIMVFVVNRRSFGWTLDMIVPPELLAQAVGLAVVGALLAGIHPAWRMTRTPTWEALRGE